MRVVFLLGLLTLLLAASALRAPASPTPSTASPAASPTPEAPMTAPSASILPAPYDLRRTTNRNDCRSHGGGSFCQNPSHLNKPVLIWEWKGNPSSLDGFRLYMLTGGRTLINQIPALLNQQIVFAYTAHAGQCFVVTAYKGAHESADSNKWCAPYTVAP